MDGTLITPTPPELGAGGPIPLSQAEVVAALAAFARRWRDPADSFRRRTEALVAPFPFAMVRVSLDALLDSLTPDALWRLIDSEGVRDACGVPLVGHVIAGNTPLLAWTSVLRALLMRSASLVKLPSGDAAEWGRLFHASLAEVSPALASSVELQRWAGGTRERDRALCESVDLVLAYGSDETINALRALCPPDTPLVGYGHRVSFGLVLDGADWDEAARGFATDILLYDQGGCLSPQTIFVEGDWGQAQFFAAGLADALAAAVPEYPLPHRDPRAAGRVREARALARMEAGTHLWEDHALRWTVIARPAAAFTLSPTHGVVSVQPLASRDALPAALAPVRRHLQGCALAAPSLTPPELAAGGLGVSYLCPPGRLQAPPLSWPQDDRPVLRSLLP
ncbi:MAG: hypothetical protein JO250_03390 [Armatimonadetes bacterium]|nr:hypothetical protein [Armatimonadota bacterium]